MKLLTRYSLYRNEASFNISSLQHGLRGHALSFLPVSVPPLQANLFDRIEAVEGKITPEAEKTHPINWTCHMLTPVYRLLVQRLESDAVTDLTPRLKRLTDSCSSEEIQTLHKNESELELNLTFTLNQPFPAWISPYPIIGGT
ncbi:hypothetical protein J6590_041791 [Homalodisca vitripennis]|nr:hypothetical protein J6590_041791 [Homalodisca vitripennis]